MADQSNGLKEQGIPPQLLPKVRAWWDGQMADIASARGGSSASAASCPSECSIAWSIG